MRIVPLPTADGTRACADILASLPEWFGRPDAVSSYVAEVTPESAVFALDQEVPVGVMVLRPHFASALEVRLLAVERHAHRLGAGRALISHAAQVARTARRDNLLVSTVGPQTEDPFYAGTRAFYAAQGFKLLIDAGTEPGGVHMAWLIRRLQP